MALDKNNASRFLVPLGALAALAVAIGVWLVPSSVLDPKPPDLGPIDQVIPDIPEIKGQKIPDEQAWMTVAQDLDALREPEEIKEPEPEQIEDSTGEGEDPDDEKPAPRPSVTVAWEYEGYVEQPDRAAALIRVMGTQRFVFEGDEVTDNALPPGVTATIAEITPDHIVVEINGGEQTIERATSDGSGATGGPTQRRPPQRPNPRQRRS